MHRKVEQQAIAATLRQLVSAGHPRLAKMGLAARDLYDAQFSVARTTSQAEELLTAVAARRGRGLLRVRPTDVVRA